ncbi:MAG: helix-turn-helix transcriptional regulator [Bacteroidales bacterium]|nr:helix-turn-helix transcriptional regulator [Bacteroidales bacterium]
MTQTEFADLFDLKRTAVGSYEEGRAEAKIDTIIKIADYFKLSLDQLLRKELTINDIFHFRDDLLNK